MHKPTKPEVRTLLTGLLLGESPRWHDGRLWFSDWGAQKLIAVDPAGNSEVITEVKSLPFSIDFLADGRLLILSSAERKILRREADGTMAVHAELAGISEKPWNEIVVDGRGNIYVNSIGFAFPGEDFAPGFIVLVKPDGTISKVAEDLAFPNGMLVTPDNATLVVAESYGCKLTAFDIAEDGSLSNPRAWAEVDGHPDGICMDAEGAIWFADVPNKRCVRVREGGEVLQVIDTDRGCFACMLGGADGRTLFIVAAEWRGPASMGAAPTGKVLMAEAPAAGVGWPAS